MHLQQILAIASFVVISTIWITFYCLQYHFGQSDGPHGIHSMTNMMMMKNAPFLSHISPIVPSSPDIPNKDASLHNVKQPPIMSTSVPVSPALVSLKQLAEPHQQEVVKFHVTGEKTVAYDDSQYLAYLHKSKTSFRNHLGHTLNKQKGLSLDDYMLHLSKQPHCSTRPIFMSMARVSSDLYWHLIENFFYTMQYFDNLVSDC